MSDPFSSQYYSPLDSLVGSPLSGSRTERLAEGLSSAGQLGNLNDKANGKNFQDIFSETAKDNTFNGCHPLTPLNCMNINGIQEMADKNTKSDVQALLDNISNFDKPGFKRTLALRDKNGNYIQEEVGGRLSKTNWNLDFAIDGAGKGFKLANGEYTRDGRFKYNAEGKLVTVDGEIPLEICYQENAPADWSLKDIKVDFDGNVTDQLNGQVLGQIEVDKEPRSRIAQSYLETANINLPLEFMGLAQKLRLVDLSAQIFASTNKLDSEATNMVRALN
jgi:flagellar basal body rod protein FlgG